MTNHTDTETIALDDPRAIAILESYRLYLNFYSAPDQLFDTLDEFINDPDIAATLIIRPIDYFANALHAYFDYDTCPLNIIATFDADQYMTSIQLSTDSMPFEPMILDLNRR